MISTSFGEFTCFAGQTWKHTLKWSKVEKRVKETQTLFWPMEKQGKEDKEGPTTYHI
jgi:hypothetical protein